MTACWAIAHAPLPLVYTADRPEIQECVLQMPPEQAGAHCNADPECKAFILKQREEEYGWITLQAGPAQCAHVSHAQGKHHDCWNRCAVGMRSASG